MKKLTLLSTAPLLALALALVALSGGPGPASAEIVPTGPTPTPRAGTGQINTQSGVPGLTSFGPPPISAPQVPTAINVCSLGGEFRHGGDETLALTNFTLDLPYGADYVVATITRAGASSVEVCYVPDGSVLKLHDVSGGEISRTARSNEAHWSFDAIAGSVRAPFDVSLGVRVPTLTTIAP